jgi:hypothetical protein
MTATKVAVRRYHESTLRRMRRRYLGTFYSVASILALVAVLGQVYERFMEAQSFEATEKSDAERLPGAGPRPVEILEEGVDYRIVRHASGVTRIPASPRRICALASADELLSIGVIPAAHSIKDGNFPDYLEEALKDVPWIPNVYGDAMPNLEAIIAVRPDLIITRAPDRQTYLQLSKIAPVVVLLPPACIGSCPSLVPPACTGTELRCRRNHRAGQRNITLELLEPIPEPKNSSRGRERRRDGSGPGNWRPSSPTARECGGSG